MSSLEQGFGHQSQNVVVHGEVEQAVAVTSNGDNTGQAQLGEMLRDCGRCDTYMLGKVVDRVLAVEQ